MQAVTVDELDAQLLGQMPANQRLSASGNSHDDDQVGQFRLRGNPGNFLILILLLILIPYFDQKIENKKLKANDSRPFWSKSKIMKLQKVEPWEMR